MMLRLLVSLLGLLVSLGQVLLQLGQTALCGLALLLRPVVGVLVARNQRLVVIQVPAHVVSLLMGMATGSSWLCLAEGKHTTFGVAQGP